MGVVEETGVAGIFGSLGADFLFAAQILVYVSGIAVLILFVVLLSGRASDFVLRQTNEQWAGGLVVCGAKKNRPSVSPSP